MLKTASVGVPPQLTGGRMPCHAVVVPHGSTRETARDSPSGGILLGNDGWDESTNHVVPGMPRVPMDADHCPGVQSAGFQVHAGAGPFIHVSLRSYANAAHHSSSRSWMNHLILFILPPHVFLKPCFGRAAGATVHSPQNVPLSLSMRRYNRAIATLLDSSSYCCIFIVRGMVLVLILTATRFTFLSNSSKMFLLRVRLNWGACGVRISLSPKLWMHNLCIVWDGNPWNYVRNSMTSGLHAGFNAFRDALTRFHSDEFHGVNSLKSLSSHSVTVFDFLCWFFYQLSVYINSEFSCVIQFLIVRRTFCYFIIIESSRFCFVLFLFIYSDNMAWLITRPYIIIYELVCITLKIKID